MSSNRFPTDQQTLISMKANNNTNRASSTNRQPPPLKVSPHNDTTSHQRTPKRHDEPDRSSTSNYALLRLPPDSTRRTPQMTPYTAPTYPSSPLLKLAPPPPVRRSTDSDAASTPASSSSSDGEEAHSVTAKSSARFALQNLSAGDIRELKLLQQIMSGRSAAPGPAPKDSPPSSAGGGNCTSPNLLALDTVNRSAGQTGSSGHSSAGSSAQPEDSGYGIFR